jgi:hypothetical protein
MPWFTGNVGAWEFKYPTKSAAGFLGAGMALGASQEGANNCSEHFSQRMLSRANGAVYSCVSQMYAVEELVLAYRQRTSTSAFSVTRPPRYAGFGGARASVFACLQGL